MDAVQNPTERPIVRTANDDYVLSRTLVDPDVKPSVDAYMKEVTRTPEAARQFLQKVGLLTEDGKLAESYGG